MPKSSKTSSVEVDETDSHTSTNYINSVDFDVKKFYVKPIEEKMGTKSQYMAFPKYKLNKNSKDGDSVIIVTEPIKLTKGGIPKLDGEYRKSDSDREFFWLGCDKEQKSCVDLFTALENIDDVYSDLIQNNNDTKTIHHMKDGKKEPLDKLEYVPLVRESSQPENKDNDKQYEAYNRIKVRFSTKYVANQDEAEPSEITTHLFLLDKEDPEPYTTVTDFEKSLRWGCEARFVLTVNKFWAMKALKNKKRECGFTVKCLQVYITKESTHGGGTSQVEKFRKRLFSPNGTALTVTESKPVKSNDNNNDSSSESDSDSDTNTKVKNSKTSAKQQSQQSDSDSDSESDKKTQKKSSSKKSKSDTEESDSEDEKTTKTKAKAKVKKVAKSDTEESDSEDEKAKAKPKPKAKGKN
jgi:hypothetical protein